MAVGSCSNSAQYRSLPLPTVFFPNPGPVEGVLLARAHERRQHARSQSHCERSGRAGLRVHVGPLHSVKAVDKNRADDVEEDEDDHEVFAKWMAQKLETPSTEMRERMVDCCASSFIFPPQSGHRSWRIHSRAVATSYPVRGLRGGECRVPEPRPKLLAKFTLMPEEPDVSELEWFVGADVPPANLQRILKVIEQIVMTVKLERRRWGSC
ncbi:hypothetical protein C8F04DRAFT_1263735 [Mycena alexandri]|uniref:Uncharacterized protein n=1 Tax=Mycena alexandri TaxID=1745969 RepID=A0AAD6SNB6_9AGAR|nr:hypothetical protein C8F04DRAFT_1263735 [Mycena alexandri]